MKEFLKTLGIEGESADKIEAYMNDSIAKSYIPLTRFNEVNTDLKNHKDSVKSLTKQIEQLKEVNPEQLQATIEQLQAENKANSEKFQKELQQIHRKGVSRQRRD